jgi:FkbM family methyltransferase
MTIGVFVKSLTENITVKHSVNDVFNFIKSNTSFAIFGTGWRAESERRTLEQIGKQITAFLTFDQISEGTTAYGLPVLRLSGIDLDKYKIIISVDLSSAAVTRRFVDEFNLDPYVDFIHVLDYYFMNQSSSWSTSLGLPFKEYLEQNVELFELARACFDRDIDRDTYDKIVRYRLLALELDQLSEDDEPYSTQNYAEAELAYSKFLNVLPSHAPDIIKHRVAWYLAYKSFDDLDLSDVYARWGDTSVLDCGAFEGETSALLAFLCPRAIIHAFEPGSGAYDKLVGLSSTVGHIAPVKAGVWDQSTSASFKGAGEGAVIDAEGDASINLITIDEYVTSNQIKGVSVIKMNIEGAEMPALRGAVNTIGKWRPKLCISIDHKSSDLWEIPIFIKTNFPDYELTLKHEGPHIFGSHVFATVRTVPTEPAEATEVARLAQEIGALRNSTSWKVSAPVRWIGNALKGSNSGQSS